jgi:hypothetical protein
VIEAKVEQCANCHADLQDVVPDRILRHQITELPVVRPLVIETQIHEVENKIMFFCPHCHTLQRGEPPAGLEPTRQFGPRLEATVIYYKQEPHLSYERIAETMRDLCGVEVSEGGINAILRRGGEAAQPQADTIGAAEEHNLVVAHSEISREFSFGSDETSARVNRKETFGFLSGRNWWQWVFRSAAGVAHIIAPKENSLPRGAEVIRQFMGSKCAECWVSDCYSAQLLAPAQHRQLCLSHQLRDLERVIEQDPQLR